MEYLNEEGLAALWDDTKEYVEKYHGEHSGGQDSDGTDAGPIVELTAKGKASQVSTTGKNLLSPTIRTVTASGVTYSVANDGTITLSGTATEDNGFTIYSGVRISSGGTYTCKLHGNIKAPLNGKADPTSSYTTFIAEGSTIGFVVSVSSGQTYDESFHAQIELGSTATSYEPYTGGAPSPSPDYPQEIQVVRGRNLIDWKVNTTSNKLSFIPKEFGSYTIHPKEALENGNWYIRVTGSDGSYLSENAIGLNEWTVASSGWVYGAASLQYVTFIVPNGSKLIEIGKLNSNGTIPAQLELGSTPTPYVPYGYVGLEAQSRNLAYVSDGNNKVIAHCEAGKTYTFSLVANYSMGVNLKKNSNSGAYVAHTDSYVLPLTFTASDSFDLFINGWSNVSGSGFTAYNFQLNEGPTAIPYEPYFHSTTPIPLPSRGWAAGLPDGTADTLTLDGAGKVVWEKKTGEVVYDGDEGWSVEPNKFASGTVPSDFPFPNSQNGKGFPAMCNAYRPNTAGSPADAVSGTFAVSPMMMTNSRISLFIWDSEHLSSASAFNTWLQSNPITILYPLATPITEQRGYVDLPDIPEGATLSIPELDALGVHYLTDDAAAEMARQWYERAKSEYEDRITSLEETVAEIIAGA